MGSTLPYCALVLNGERLHTKGKNILAFSLSDTLAMKPSSCPPSFWMEANSPEVSRRGIPQLKRSWHDIYPSFMKQLHFFLSFLPPSLLPSALLPFAYTHSGSFHKFACRRLCKPGSTMELNDKAICLVIFNKWQFYRVQSICSYADIRLVQ